MCECICKLHSSIYVYNKMDAKHTRYPTNANC